MQFEHTVPGTTGKVDDVPIVQEFTVFPSILQGLFLDLGDVEWGSKHFGVAVVLDAAFILHSGNGAVIRHERIVPFGIRDTVMHDAVFDKDVACRNRVYVLDDAVLATVVNLLGHLVIQVLALLVFTRSYQFNNFLALVKYDRTNLGIPHPVHKHHVLTGEQVTAAAGPYGHDGFIAFINLEQNPGTVIRLFQNFHGVGVIWNFTVKMTIRVHAGNQLMLGANEHDNGTFFRKEGGIDNSTDYIIGGTEISNIGYAYLGGITGRTNSPDTFQFDGIAIGLGVKFLDDCSSGPILVTTTYVDTVAEIIRFAKVLGEVGRERNNYPIPTIHVGISGCAVLIFLFKNSQLTQHLVRRGLAGIGQHAVIGHKVKTILILPVKFHEFTQADNRGGLGIIQGATTIEQREVKEDQFTNIGKIRHLANRGQSQIQVAAFTVILDDIEFTQNMQVPLDCQIHGTIGVCRVT